MAFVPKRSELERFLGPNADQNLRTLPLSEIDAHVRSFLAYARHFSDVTFQVTRIGCGLAGYKDENIAPMFAAAPPNCRLPPEWLEILRRDAAEARRIRGEIEGERT